MNDYFFTINIYEHIQGKGQQREREGQERQVQNVNFHKEEMGESTLELLSLCSQILATKKYSRTGSLYQ